MLRTTDIRTETYQAPYSGRIRNQVGPLGGEWDRRLRDWRVDMVIASSAGVESAYRLPAVGWREVESAEDPVVLAPDDR